MPMAKSVRTMPRPSSRAWFLPDQDTGVLEAAVARAFAAWGREGRRWLGAYLFLALVLAVPLAVDTPLAKVLQVQVEPLFGPGRRPPWPFWPTALGGLWLWVVALPWCAGLWSTLRQGDDHTVGWRAWTQGAWAYLARSPMRSLPVVAGAAATLLLWDHPGRWEGMAACLLGLGTVAACYHLPKDRVYPAAREASPPWLVSVVWVVAVALVGMLAAALAWTVGVWGGDVLWALGVAAVWLVLARAEVELWATGASETRVRVVGSATGGGGKGAV
jgi:hypothetical protein